MLVDTKRFLSPFCFLLFVVTAITGCGGNTGDLAGDNNQSTIQPIILTVGSTQGGDESIITTESNQQLSRDELAATFVGIKESGQVIQLVLDDGSNGKTTTRGFNISHYYVELHWENHYVPGCIHTKAPHLNLIVRDKNLSGKSGLIVDYHLCVWWDNGPQFGIYNSGTVGKVCKETRGRFTAIKDAIYDVLSRMTPMPSWACASLASTTAIGVIGIWGLGWL